MHWKVERLINSAKEKDKKVKDNNVRALLDRLGLYEEDRVENPCDGYDRKAYMQQLGEFFYYKKRYIDISDEEYEQLMRYYPLVESNTQKAESNVQEEDNGENYIVKFAKVWLIVLIAIAIITCIVGMVVSNKLFGFDWLMFLYYLLGSSLTALAGFFVYFTIQVFANISRKSSAIYQLLKPRE